MRAIITGATGGLGRNLTHYLRELGWDILAMGRNHTIGYTLGVPFVVVELSNRSAVLNAFEKADVVFHCAAFSSPWGDYDLFYRANVLATRYVLEAMQYYHIPKIIHVSTPSIYFDFNDQFNVKEKDVAKKFVNHYAATKYAAEHEVLICDRESVIIRPRGIFGEHDHVLLPRLEKIGQKGFLPLIKNKEPLVDITYVLNVVHALHLAATQSLPAKSIFNITNGEPKTIREIYTLIAQELSWKITYKEISYPLLMGIGSFLECAAKWHLTAEPLITRYGVGLISHHQTLDISHAQIVLGYQPIYTIHEGITRYGIWKNHTF
ncbi:MAG: NAD(P)-dependent oxidoreductase [Sulfuricurvum sp.]